MPHDVHTFAVLSFFPELAPAGVETDGGASVVTAASFARGCAVATVRDGSLRGDDGVREVPSVVRPL